MDAVKYLKEAIRICDTIGDCDNCPFNDRRVVFPCKASNAFLEAAGPEESVAIVEKWSAEHPAKTRQSEFLKMFPKARKEGGIISIDPCDIVKSMSDNCEGKYCDDCRQEYWNEEVE